MTQKNISIGDRMKNLEELATVGRFLPGLPVVARLDGRSFSKFTKGMQRPYDIKMSTIMQETTKYLVQETDAILGYTQSDEISLLFREDLPFFDGKIFKIVSVLTSIATAKFNRLLPDFFPEKEMAQFDCRAWACPNRQEAVNAILWRELDATKNSISMAARHYYSHKQLQGKTGKQMQEMLWKKGINWNDYPDFFKRGTYFRRSKVFRLLSSQELQKIKEKYRPTGPVERTVVDCLLLPPILKVQNRIEVIFEGAEPIIASEEQCLK
jgi:tRNA(His) 5'-end guanylyltransferase